MDWLKKSWWKSDLFISSLFGGFISTIYIFTMYALSGKLEYNGTVDFIEKLILSVMPMWTLLFVLTLFLYGLTKGIIEKWKMYFGFSEKATVGFSTFIYLFFSIIIFGCLYALDSNVFNSFAVISTLFVAVVFASSMEFSLNKVRKIGKKI